MTTPTSLFIVSGSSRRNIAAKAMTNSGTAEVIVAAMVESTLSSAQVIRVKGMATLNAPSTARWP